MNGPKQPYEIRAFGGINANHNRQLGELSKGKNFYTSSGSLITRNGCSLVTPPANIGAIKSLHSAPKVSLDTKLLLEEGNKLWHKTTNAGAWTSIKADLNGTSLDSARWLDYIILVNGNQQLAYKVSDGTLAAITNSSGGAVPSMEYVITWRTRIYGWGPNFAESHLLRYCGTNADGDIIKDNWPPDHALDIGGETGSPILDCVSFPTHLLAFTRKGYARVYGSHGDGWEIYRSLGMGIYGPRLAAMVGEMAIYLGSDLKVYGNSGSTPIHISPSIDELLMKESFANVKAFGYLGQYWLIFSNTVANTSKAYVFDTSEKCWYIYEFPFAINSSCEFGNYLGQEYLYLGLNDFRIAKMDESATDLGTAITTEFSIGPYEVESRQLKIKRLWLNAEPKNNFTLNVYTTTDLIAEEGPETLSFVTGNQNSGEVMLSGIRGQNVTHRITTTDKINELQKATIVVVPKGVK